MCKIMCKSWREVVDSLEFAKSHLSKASPHLVLFVGKGSSIAYKMVEFVDEHQSAHHCKTVSNLSLPHPGEILCSANCLLFWCNGGLRSPRDIFVCNPITREYMNLPPPPPSPLPQFESYSTAGVGVSKMGGKYKIVRILQVYNEDYELVQCECQVHTVGSGSWRSFSVGTQFKVGFEAEVTFLNGNLHWLAFDATRVSCFDLETELFTSFSSPPGLRGNKTLSVVGDRLCLCLCYKTIPYATDIWFMKEYGDEKSWTKEFIITEHFIFGDLLGWPLFPIKVIINVDEILSACKDCSELLSYLKLSKAIHTTGFHERGVLFARRSVIYTPTILSMKTLLNVTENVLSF